MAEEVRERSRLELLELVTIAVDCAKGEAYVDGHENYVKLCDDVLFPFLEAEMERESRKESCHVGSATDDPCLNRAVIAINNATPDFCLEHALGLEVGRQFGEIEAALEEAHKILMDDVRIVLKKANGEYEEEANG